MRFKANTKCGVNDDGNDVVKSTGFGLQMSCCVDDIDKNPVRTGSLGVVGWNKGDKTLL